MEQTPVRILASKLRNDLEYAKTFADNPGSAMSHAVVEFDQPAYRGDRFSYRVVVFALAIVLITAAVGAFVIEWNGKTIPQALTAFGSTSLGALAGLLAASPIRSQGGASS